MELREQGDEQRDVRPTKGLWCDTAAVVADIDLRIAPCFVRSEVRQRVQRYVFGLLGRVERKNSWQLAEAIGETGPQGVQRLLNGAVWDADGVRDELRTYVVDHLGDASSGMLIVDETGFLKKGSHSCGVARQYTGTAGTMANAQVGVFLTYASAQGAAFIDRALYLPRSWTRDPQRRAATHVPKGLHFATKIVLAQRMLARAFAARVPARWVTADSGYGRSHAFRRWLERRDQAYAVMVPKTTAVEYQGRRERAEQLGQRLPEEAWGTIAADGACEGPARHEWVCLPLSESCAKGKRRWLLVRRCPADSSDLAYYLVYGPTETPLPEVVRVCDRRWAIEEGFAEAKGEVGLDQYEVRTWTAWHRFITLGLLAHAALVVLRQRAFAAEAGISLVSAQKGGLDAPAFHLPSPKFAAWFWRYANRTSSGCSGSRGRTGDARTRQRQPAATRHSGQESSAYDRSELVAARRLFPRPQCR
jgi:SRSO17 transposase